MNHKQLNNKVLTILLSLFLTVTLSAQDPAAIDAGKALFKANCASCHNKDMKSKLTGPALGGTEERWSAFPRADLYSWIRNSQALIASGHPRATALWNEWKPTVMTSFPSLTDADIENLIAYINNPVGSGGPPEPKNVCVDATALDAKQSSNKGFYVFLFIILGLLCFLLGRIITNLNQIQDVKEGKEPRKRPTFTQILTSRNVVSFGIFAAVVLLGTYFVTSGVNFGRQQNYQPDQPIKFSHVTHACEQQIDCNYCHDGARRAKHALIPGANTCMNCHKAVKSGSKYGTAEITKIYASIGFDPNTDKYIPNYESMSQEEIQKVYTKWIGDSYIAENKKLDAAGEALIEEQWSGVVAALTNAKTGDDKIQGPIEWTRIHNLPDHVYFNHAQHVGVGKIACEQCHGDVKSMGVVKQYAPLSMGWCIQCHRKTEVKFADNKYYDNYFELYHNQIKEKQRDKVTVEDIGGTECQKCHY